MSSDSLNDTLQCVWLGIKLLQELFTTQYLLSILVMIPARDPYRFKMWQVLTKQYISRMSLVCRYFIYRATTVISCNLIESSCLISVLHLCHILRCNDRSADFWKKPMLQNQWMLERSGTKIDTTRSREHWYVGDVMVVLAYVWLITETTLMVW